MSMTFTKQVRHSASFSFSFSARTRLAIASDILVWSSYRFEPILCPPRRLAAAASARSIPLPFSRAPFSRAGNYYSSSTTTTTTQEPSITLNDTCKQFAYYQPHLKSLPSLRSAVESQLQTDRDLSEQEVLASFKACSEYVRQKRCITGGGRSEPPSAATNTPTSAILSSLDENESAQSEEVSAISSLAYKVLSNPSVFITPRILNSYITLQIQLRRLDTLPSAFALYSQKPYRKPNSSKLTIPNPNHPKLAVPDTIAKRALDAAILSKNMPLCLDIIAKTYGAKAYQNSKILRKASPLIATITVCPFAIYVLAGKLANFAPDANPVVATNLAFGGILAYLVFTGTIGLIAVATRNDQMVRITWVPGTPLRYRWLQEEERAAYDVVAQAWGFQEVNQRGFEEGPEWELLRSTVASKGMIVDNPALLEGME